MIMNPSPNKSTIEEILKLICSDLSIDAVFLLKNKKIKLINDAITKLKLVDIKKDIYLELEDSSTPYIGIDKIYNKIYENIEAMYGHIGDLDDPESDNKIDTMLHNRTIEDIDIRKSKNQITEKLIFFLE